MRVLGILLVILGAVLAGEALCRERKRRQRQLRDLIQGLNLMLGELQLHASPLDELLSLAEGPAGEAGCFFAAVGDSMERLGEESFSEIWRRAAENRLPGLNAASRDELARLGVILGRMDLEAETEAVAACRDALLSQLAAERAELPGFRRLSLGLSVCVGALLAILLF